MPLIEYVSRNFKPASLKIIAHANTICANMAAQGYDLTLRQLYYQFVAQGLIPNTQKDYKNLGSIVNDARLAGLLDWDYIIDRTRNLQSLPHWSSPETIVSQCAKQFALDKWNTQPYRVEVWVEKDALVGVVEQAADSRDCPYFACRGYASQSEIWGAAQRISRYMKDYDQNVIILHLGDHDPSGIDMTRDIEDRLKLFLKNDYMRWTIDNGCFIDFVSQEWDEDWGDEPEPDVDDFSEWDPDARSAFGAWWVAQYGNDRWETRLEIRRIALNWNQIQQYNPPPNPAKITDSRAGLDQFGNVKPGSYIDRFGYDSWELDSLNPAVIDQLIVDEIDSIRDDALYQAEEDAETEHRRLLKEVADDWENLTDGL